MFSDLVTRWDTAIGGTECDVLNVKASLSDWYNPEMCLFVKLHFLEEMMLRFYCFGLGRRRVCVCVCVYAVGFLYEISN